jgi:ribose transport system substrate-binding protein
MAGRPWAFNSFKTVRIEQPKNKEGTEEKMNLKKSLKGLIGIAAAVLLLCVLAACKGKQPASGTAAAPAKAAEKQLTIGAIYLTSEHPYYQAHEEWTKRYCAELGIRLIGIDGKLDQANMATQMENLIAQKVDGIIYCLLEPVPSSVDINAAQAAGIPVVTFAIKHDPNTASCPFVGIDEFDAGRLGGVQTGNLYKELFGNKKANVAIIEMPGQSASENRSNGFFDGFKSVVADTVLTARMNGSGVKDRAMAVTEDIIQSHPEINVFYGANGDQGLGALSALETAGRGTIATEIVISHDGSEPEILKIADPKSALKVAIGNRPKELSRMTIDTLLEVINGKRDMRNNDDIYVATAVVTGKDLDYAQEFIADEYVSTTKIK